MPKTIQEENGKSILVAEDNPINQEITVRILLKAGYRVEAVADGLEVLETVKANSYDLILMDCQMPQMDGYEATREVRRRGLKIPIIALTANALKEDREQCLAAGMSDYVTKPVHAQTLLRAVDNWLSANPITTSVIDLKVIEALDALDEDGSQGLIAKLVQLYIDTVPQGLHELRGAAVIPGPRLVKQAHFLKSSHANLGMHKAVAILQKMEDGDYKAKDLPELISQLETEIQRGIAELQRLHRR